LGKNGGFMVANARQAACVNGCHRWENPKKTQPDKGWDLGDMVVPRHHGSNNTLKAPDGCEGLDDILP
jgi:hypothetical protein